MTDATELDAAGIRAEHDARASDGEIGYVRDDLSYVLRCCFECDEPVPCRTSRLLAALDEARAEVERLHSWSGLMELLNEHWPADIFPTLPDDDRRDLGPRIVSLIRMVDQETRARMAAEGALAAVRALVGSVGPRSATAGSPYSTGRWDAFAEVRAALDGETEDGVFGDPDIHARLTRAALATPTTPEETQP